MTKKENYFIYGLLLLTVAIWGGTFVAVKYIVAVMPPLTGAYFRFLLASLCLVPVLIWKEGKGALIKFRDLPLMILLALTGIAFYNYFFFNGLKLTSGISGGLIIAFSPVLTTVIAPFLLGEELRTRQVLGFLISLCGVVFIISKGSWQTLATLEINKGDLLISGGATCWSI